MKFNNRGLSPALRQLVEDVADRMRLPKGPNTRHAEDRPLSRSLDEDTDQQSVDEVGEWGERLLSALDVLDGFVGPTGAPDEVYKALDTLNLIGTRMMIHSGRAHKSVPPPLPSDIEDVE